MAFKEIVIETQMLGDTTPSIGRGSSLATHYALQAVEWAKEAIDAAKKK